MSSTLSSRDSAGRYEQVREPWTPERWDDGYLDNNGRFRVYRPDFPGGFVLGYAHRHRVVYWLATGQPIPDGYDLHHLNGDRADDRFENLELMTHGEHSRLTNIGRTEPLVLTCPHCQQPFRAKKRKDSKVRFCSQACYHAHPRSEAHKAAQATGIKRSYTEGRR